MKDVMLTLQQAQEIYQYAGNEVRVSLEKAFGKEALTGIQCRVKDYIDACRVLGIEPYDEERLKSMGIDEADIAYLKMTVIVDALNEGWKPDVCNNDVRRWRPLFSVHNGMESFTVEETFPESGVVDVNSGVRLALKSEELADYCATQFRDIWKTMLISK